MAIVGLSAVASSFAPLTHADPPIASNNEQPVVKSYGIEKRELWTTSKVKGSPEPPNPYAIAKAYPKQKFNEPLELTPVPGRKAWVVAERYGKIFTFDGDFAK